MKLTSENFITKFIFLVKGCTTKPLQCVVFLDSNVLR